MDWYLKALKQYADFSGRARRAEYWWFVLIYILIDIVLMIIDAIAGTQVLVLLFAVAMLLPSLAVGVRRLHDIDRSGWWLLIGFVPIIGFIVLLFWAAQPGGSGSNRFGPDPMLEPAP